MTLAILKPEPVEVLPFPSASKVGDFLVRAASASGRTGAVACREFVGGGGDPFAIVAAPIICAGWRWARALHPKRYWSGQWVDNPAERWARLELAAGTAVNKASLRAAVKCNRARALKEAREKALNRKGGQWGVSEAREFEKIWSKREAARLRAQAATWQRADTLQAEAMALWLDEGTQIVVSLTGLALMLAVHLDRELRLCSYVEG